MFLWYMLAHDQSFFYHHQNDPGVQAMLAEARKMQDQNADLKKQLTEMNQQMANMKTSQIPADEHYIPQNAKDIAFSADRAVQEDDDESSHAWIWWLFALLISGGIIYAVIRHGNNIKGRK